MTQTQRECMENLEAKIDDLAEKVEKMYKIIDGNGHPGLREQAQLNTSHRERMEKIIDGLWLKVLLIWVSSMGTVAVLIKFLAGR